MTSKKEKIPNFKPTIINSKSNFVVITYWWGKDNYNKNTQRPCPEDVTEKTVLTRQPMTYGQMIKRWRKSCRDNSCNYMDVEYPEFAVKGGYQTAINYKPEFIKEALIACNPRGVLYIDGDMVIKKYPHIFDLSRVDYMALGWNLEVRAEEDAEIFCYDPYVLEVSGGTMYFGQTSNAVQLLKQWKKDAKRYPGKADDAIFRYCFNRRGSLLSYNIIELPQEYLWLTLELGRFTRIDKKNIYIEHPDCLTSEEIAIQQGASIEGREPSDYKRHITHQVKCKKRKIIFYEYVMFPNKGYVNSLKPLLDFVKKQDIIEVVPFNMRYGEFNDIAEKNLDIMKTIKFQVNTPDVKVYITRNRGLAKKYVHLLKGPKRNVIPTILKYLKEGNKVIYVPDEAAGVSVTKISKDASSRIFPYDLILRNKGSSVMRYRPEYTLSIDTDYPIFFGHESEVLRHLLTMSRSFSSMSWHFNYSFDFISRIRCKWV